MSVIKLIGDAPNQVSRNKQLGDLAFQDAANIAGSVTAGSINNTPIGSTTASTGAFTTLTSTSDATINGVKVGRGGGSVATNTAVGASAINATATGASNTGVGYRALTANTSGAENTALGQDALLTSTTGGSNSAVGFMALYSATTAGSNTAIGHQSGYLITTGAKNTIIGRYSGNQGGLDIRTTSNNIVLSDGDGNPRLLVNSVGNVGIGTVAPNASALLDVQSTTKGVRMPNMTTTEKNAIASPAAGLMVFDTTLSKLCVYSGVAWQTITSV